MSNIFDALQRAEAEERGTHSPFASAFGLVSELLKASEVVPEVVSVSPVADFESVPLELGPNSRLVALTDRNSLAAEQFRFLSVRLRQLQLRRPLKKVLITSTIPEEGKSVVCGNLAATLGRKKDQKVLLLEGDLRRPVLADRLGLSGLSGLSECIRGDISLMQAIYRVEGAGFWFLPAGSPPDNPLELMQSARLSTLLEEISPSFDWIVMDSPPILPLADTTVWARMADGILLVTREGITEKKQLRQGVSALDQSKLLGVILNGYSNGNHQKYYQRYGPYALSPQTTVRQRSATNPSSEDASPSDSIR